MRCAVFPLLSANSQDKLRQFVRLVVEVGWNYVREMLLLKHTSKFGEVFQQLQTGALAFFRVKLRREEIVAPDGRAEGAVVFRFDCDD